MDTLNGGRVVTVVKADGSKEDITVRQLPLKDYSAAFAAFDNEMELVSVICAKDKNWVFTLAPDSYEELLLAVQAVNDKGFFAYAARQNERLTKRLNSVKPEVLQAVSAKALQPLPPGLQPRA